MIKKALVLLLLIVSLLHSNNLEAKVVMVFGDSLSAGYGMKMSESWVKLLESRFLAQGNSHQVVNASISGNTSGNGLGRIGTDLDLHKPDILILELGGNDGLRGHSPKLFKANMEKIINQALERNVKVMILGIKLPPSHGRRYNLAFTEVFTSLISQYNLASVPFFMDKVAGHSDLMQKDGIHPNAKGQPQLLANVWPVLKSLL